MREAVLFTLDQSQGVAIEPDVAFVGAEFANQFDFTRVGQFNREFERSPIGVSADFIGSFAAGDADAGAVANIAQERGDCFGFGQSNESVFARIEHDSAAP